MNSTATKLSDSKHTKGHQHDATGVPMKTVAHHLVLGIAVVTAGWLLNSFSSVVQAQRDRGDLRLEQQATTGEWLLPDERDGELVHAQPVTLALVSLPSF